MCLRFKKIHEVFFCNFKCYVPNPQGATAPVEQEKRDSGRTLGTFTSQNTACICNKTTYPFWYCRDDCFSAESQETESR